MKDIATNTEVKHMKIQQSLKKMLRNRSKGTDNSMEEIL